MVKQAAIKIRKNDHLHRYAPSGPAIFDWRHFCIFDFITLEKKGLEKVEEEDRYQPQDDEEGDVPVFVVSRHIFASRGLAPPRPGTGIGPVPRGPSIPNDFPKIYTIPPPKARIFLAAVRCLLFLLCSPDFACKFRSESQ